MSQDISLLGASYFAVPAVQLPKQGGGTASFWDVSDTTCVASDVQSGKRFHKADGTSETGTATIAVNFLLAYEFTDSYTRVSITPSYADTKTAIQNNAKFSYMCVGDYACGMVFGISTNYNFHGTTFSECCRFILEDTVVGGMYQVAFGYVGGSLTTRTYKIYSNVPTGTINITQNGTTDVSSYASANVQVPQTGTDFIVKVAWNSSTQRYEPNKTFSEIQTAYNAGKTIAVVSNEESADNAVDGEYHTGANPYFEYWVRKYMDGYSPQTIREIGYHLTSTGINTEDDINYIRPSGNLPITQNGNNIDVTNYSTVSVNVSGGSSKNIQVNSGSNSVRTNGYTSTGHSLTVAKTGTYKVSWTAWRSSSQGTMGTNLYRNSTAGTPQQTWTNTYGQHIVLNNQSYTVGDVLTLYATAGSTSRYCWVAGLTIEEQ